MSHSEPKRSISARVGVKPLSVNQCWQGRRYKTPAYKAFEKIVLSLMPAKTLDKPPYAVRFEFGFSNSTSDIDNPIKPVLDIIQAKYSINDRDIYRLWVDKKVVKRGYEYIFFEIFEIDNQLNR